MTVTKHLGKLFEEVFEDIEREVLEAGKRRRVDEEDTITGRLLANAESRINNFGSNQPNGPEGLRIEANHYSSKHGRSEETISGADGAVVLIINIGGTTVQKFYLFQAKRAATGKTANLHAIEQRNKMLDNTADSYFLYYTPTEFRFISAFLLGQGDHYSSLPSKSYKDFHVDFFNCFIGDHFRHYPFPYHLPSQPYEYFIGWPWVYDILEIRVNDNLENRVF